LHPDDATGVHIGFQRRYGRRVLCIEVSKEGVVPVKDDHAILAEVEPSQVCGRKHRKGVPISRDGIRKDGRAPGIVRLEYSVIVWRCLAIGKGIVNCVASYKLVAIRRETES
jgi:hypothetical protein